MITIIWYCSTIFLHVKPCIKPSMELTKTVTILNTAVTPLLNPFIYTFRNTELKNTLTKALPRQTKTVSKGLVQDCLPQSSRKEKPQRHLRFQRKTSVRKRWNCSQLLAKVICNNINIHDTIFTNFTCINKNNFTHQNENNHYNCLEAENLHTSHPQPSATVITQQLATSSPLLFRTCLCCASRTQ